MVTAEPLRPDIAEHNGGARRRSVPQDLAAEQAVIGGILLREDGLERVAHLLEPRDFVDPRHRALYAAALDVWGRSESVDPVTVGAELNRRERLDEAGGHGYVAELVAELPTAVGLEHYAKVVQRAATYRGLITAAGDIADLAYVADPNVEASLSEAVDRLYSVRGAEERREFRPLQDLLADVLQEDEAAAPDLQEVRTGFQDLDTLLNGGMNPSDMVVLAARPGIGKSALALSMARNAALGQSASVAMFSLEMSAEQVAARLVAAESGVQQARLRVGRHTDEQEQAISRAIGMLSRAQIYIDDTAGQTLSEIRSKARNLHKLLRDQSMRSADGTGPGRGLGLIIVDHIQLVHAWGRASADTNRVSEMSMVSRTLKEIARELRVPVLALSQLSRRIENRHPPTPMLADLRESGSIEQDADVVVFIIREKARSEGEDDLGSYTGGNELAELYVAKHRHGPTGRAQVRFVAEVARFEDLNLQEPPQGEGWSGDQF